MTVAGRRLYPIQVAEKGFAPYRIHVTGTWGHGSMPRDDNAAVLAARVVERLAAPGPIRSRRSWPVPRGGRRGPPPATAAAVLRRLRRAADAAAADAALDALCDPMYARALRALLRDTLCPDVIHAGVKYNVIPGDAVIEVDCRVLPGMTEPQMRGRGRGPHRARAAAPPATIELHRLGRAGRLAGRRPAVGHPRATLRDHDPDGDPAPGHGAVRDRRQGDVPLGVPTYGFSPLRLDPDERFLERFHGVDERVVARRAALRATRPVRRRPPLLRLSRELRRQRPGGAQSLGSPVGDAVTSSSQRRARVRARRRPTARSGSCVGRVVMGPRVEIAPRARPSAGAGCASSQLVRTLRRSMPSVIDRRRSDRAGKPARR